MRQTVHLVPPDAATVSDPEASTPPGSGALLPGDHVGRYVVVESVGQGAMGRVARAYDPKLGREVAIKQVHAGATADDVRTRLIREARAMARLSHPNVVPVYDVEPTDDGIAIAMEFVPGGTLRDWMDAGPHPAREVLGALLLAGEGLAAAHRVELVHRDFKPANVLVAADGRVKVTDFGLAKPIGQGSSLGEVTGAMDSGSDALTRDGTVMGTPRYMAPEQHHGASADARADQFAFCVTLWEALTDQAPYRGSSLQTLAEQKRGGPPPWPAVPGVAPAVVDALRRGLSPDPDARFASMGALLQALHGARARQRRQRWTWMGGGLALAMVAGWGAWDYQQRAAVTACQDSHTELHPVWPGLAAPVQAAIAASPLPYARVTWERAEPRVLAWAQQWSATQSGVCLAARVEATAGPELYRRSQACLDLSKIQMQTVLERVAARDDTVMQGLVTAVASIEDPARCGQPWRMRHGSWPDDDQWDEVDALRRRLARAHGLQVSGHYAQAQTEAQAVVDAAEAIGFAPLLAEARLRLGVVLELQADYEGAERELRAAYFEAASSDAASVAFGAAARLVFTIGERRGQPDAGLAWRQHAEVFQARIADAEPAMIANLQSYLGVVHRAKGDLAAAKEHQQLALSLLHDELGEDHPDVAATSSNLALVLGDLGDYETAARLHERALAIRERTLGPDHPYVGSSVGSLAALRQAMGQPEQAGVLQRRAIEIFERALGPEHPKVAIALNSLAIVEMSQGETHEATVHAERALAIRQRALAADDPEIAASLDVLAALRWRAEAREEAKALRIEALQLRERALGPAHPHVAHSLDNRTTARGSSTRWGSSTTRASTTRALQIASDSLGPDHRNVAHIQRGLAHVALDQGRAADAVVLAEQSLATAERAGVSAREQADTRVLLAQAQWAAGSRETAVQALRQLAASTVATDDAELAREIDAWLAEHDRGAPAP